MRSRTLSCRSAVLILILLVAQPILAGAQESGAKPKLALEKIRLPPGFSIDVYAENVRNARGIAIGSQGTVFVGSRTAGKVHAVLDRDGDAKAEEVLLLAEDLLMPSGVAFRDGALYVAEVHRIWRYDKIEERLADPPEPVLVTERFPKIRHHGWKFIAFGPDGWLYVPVGAPCNLCESVDEIFASIGRLRPDGSGYEVLARGVRNTVGFDWHPETGELWFTDNGRDYLGEDVPPDELNVLKEKGQHFGYPYCHGKSVADPVFGEKRPCSELSAPAIELGPHVAAIGMRFYDGEMFPPEYKNRILIAEHGSWNREEAIGYRVMQVRLEGDKAVSYKPFAEGWLPEEGRAWGRPADVEVMGDGSVLVSDDRNGILYRITYAE